MNVASLFNLHGPDLVIILLIVLLARRRWMGKEARRPEELENPVAMVNRLLVPAAIIIFLLACGLWFFGSSH